MAGVRELRHYKTIKFAQPIRDSDNTLSRSKGQLAGAGYTGGVRTCVQEC